MNGRKAKALRRAAEMLCGVAVDDRDLVCTKKGTLVNRPTTLRAKIGRLKTQLRNDK